MNVIKDFGLMLASTAIVTALLAAYFNWRARLLSQFGLESHEH